MTDAFNYYFFTLDYLYAYYLYSCIMRPAKQVTYAVQEIEKVFSKDERVHIPAWEFLQRIQVNTRTLNKARKLLRIQSKRRQEEGTGKFIVHWSRTGAHLSKALQEITDKHEQGRRNHCVARAAQDCAIMIKGMMSEYPEQTAQDMIKECRQLWSPATISKAKRIAGAASIRRDNVWYWLYPAEEIIYWLENYLLDKPPVPEDDIYDAAAREHGWSDELIDLARRVSGDDIRRLYRNSYWCWYHNLNGAPRGEWS